MQLTKTCLSLGLAMSISQFAFADWVDDAIFICIPGCDTG